LRVLLAACMPMAGARVLVRMVAREKAMPREAMASLAGRLALVCRTVKRRVVRRRAGSGCLSQAERRGSR